MIFCWSNLSLKKAIRLGCQFEIRSEMGSISRIGFTIGGIDDVLWRQFQGWKDQRIHNGNRDNAIGEPILRVSIVNLGPEQVASPLA